MRVENCCSYIVIFFSQYDVDVLVVIAVVNSLCHFNNFWPFFQYLSPLFVFLLFFVGKSL